MVLPVAICLSQQLHLNYAHCLIIYFLKIIFNFFKIYTPHTHIYRKLYSFLSYLSNIYIYIYIYRKCRKCLRNFGSDPHMTFLLPGPMSQNNFMQPVVGHGKVMLYWVDDF